MRLRETVVISGGLLTQQIATFATGIIIARSLGAGAYGALATLKGLTTFLAIVTPLGLDLALLKHGALYKGRQPELRTLSLTLRALSAALNLCLLALVAAWGGPLLQQIYTTIPEFSYLCVLSMVALVFAADIQISSALFRVNDAVTLYSVLVNYWQPTVRLVLSGIVIYAGGGVISILWVNAVTSLATLAGLVLVDPSRLVPVVRVAGFNSKLRDIVSESLWMALLLLVGQTMRFVDVIVLSALTTPTIAGEYTAMSNVAQLILIYPGAISQTLGPQIAFLHHSGDRRAMAAALEDYVRKASLLGGYLFAGIAVFGSQLDLVFGREFRFSWQLASLLAFGWFISATLGPVSYALSMTGRHKQDFAVLVLGTVLLLVSLRVTVPMFREIGAALSVVIAFAAVNTIRSVVVAKTLRINPVKLSYVLPPICFLIIAGCSEQLGMTIGSRSFVRLVLQCLLYTAVSLALFLGVFATPSERRKVFGYCQLG